MKLIRLIALFIAFLPAFVARSQTPAKPISVTAGWKIQTGDNTHYAETGFDDQAWKPINVGASWESQGFADYNGVAWYRTRVVIPSSLKTNPSYLKGVLLTLGRVDDDDQTFINGTEIGQTNGYDRNRQYVIPFDLIRWDQSNVLAVRVNDNSGNGGLANGPYLLGGSVKLSAAVSVSVAGQPTLLAASGSGTLAKTITITTLMPLNKLAGTLNVTVYSPVTKAVLFQQSKSVTLSQPGGLNIPITVPTNGAGSYWATYTFRTQSAPDSITRTTLIGYSAAPHTNEHLTAPIVALTVPEKASPFALEAVKFSGFLQDRLSANLTQRLLNIDETGIMEGFYSRPGKQTWVGEYPGKYLHAASRVWRYSKNAQLKSQMDRIVNVLIATQLEDGYLGTYLPAQYWSDWDVWAHKYDMLGLLSYYEATGYKPALETSRRVGDLLCRTFGNKPGQRNIMESGHHVGMASGSVLEPMTELYRFTGDKKYLDFCNYIVDAYETPEGPKIISTLTTVGKVDKTANAKAYEMMSNLVGIVRLYQLTGNPVLLKATTNAWKDIAAYKLYITGTTSEGEHFKDDFDLPATNAVHMGEGCVTTTWLQLSQALHAVTGEATYVDEIEKSIFNHLFAAENPQTGCVSYYTALQGKKPYRCTIDGHCCLASVPRGFAIIPELIYTRTADTGLSVNSYSAGSVRGTVLASDRKKVGFELRVDSRFPEEGRATLTLNPDRQASGPPARFTVGLHVPAWCQNFKAVVAGKTFAGIPGQYLSLAQAWAKGSVIQVSFDLHTQLLDGGKSYPGFVALKSGPQVLAIDKALNPQINDLASVSLNSTAVTPLSKSQLPKGWVGSQLYSVQGMADGKPATLKVVPYAEAGQTGGDLEVWVKKAEK